MKKLSYIEADLKKSVTYKKSVYIKITRVSQKLENYFDLIVSHVEEIQ